MKPDFSQSSTIRGLIWVGGGVFAIIAYFIGKDPTPILTITATVAGAHGIFSDDSKPVA